jgi:hypothetical protein
MLSPRLRESLAAPSRTLCYIWLAFTVAIPFYVFLAHNISSNITGQAGPQIPILLPVLALVAVVDLVFSVFWRRTAFTDAALKTALTETPRSGGEDLDEHERRLHGLMSYIQTKLIVCWACIEAIAIYGLFLVFARFDFAVILPFSAVALIGMLLFRPQPERIIERAAKLAHQA